ncbi:hypothetical protein FRACA_170015 [Frankia canadensis]|uniref:Uncharacterized protein n=1 Tax=Frankia canadensis TaxID=1836972 RepID=A0A2I2KN11_9ACTN|nr:hypothetical protein [Frankia canadensis]SNQ47055.1 hypothetical protein FRACA_170015 [Frankia canadensis]SOU54345.1 hypothetical protein FRACA_170015 [Frankia canadensis]
MGIRLIVEILDHHGDVPVPEVIDGQGRVRSKARVGLAAGELRDLLVLAENANDESRETWLTKRPDGRFDGVHADYIRRRAGGKSAAAWRNSITGLLRIGVIVHAEHDGRKVAGHRGSTAVYRIACLCPDPPHDGHRGLCTKPESVTVPVTQSPEMGHGHDDPSVANGSSSTVESVIVPMTQTPGLGHRPHDPSLLCFPSDPLSLAKQPRSIDQLISAAGLDEREIKNFRDWVTEEHQPRSAGWWRTVADHGDLPGLIADWRKTASPTIPATPPWCGACGGGNQAARTNARFRTDSGATDGIPCPHCHPDHMRRTA